MHRAKSAGPHLSAGICNKLPMLPCLHGGSIMNENYAECNQCRLTGLHTCVPCPVGSSCASAVPIRFDTIHVFSIHANAHIHTRARARAYTDRRAYHRVSVIQACYSGHFLSHLSRTFSEANWIPCNAPTARFSPARKRLSRMQFIRAVPWRH